MENTYPDAPPVRLHEPPDAAPELHAARPGPLLGGSSPLRTEAFKAALKDHPDRQYRDYIVIGLAEEFRVGFDRRQPLRLATRNLPSRLASTTASSQRTLTQN